MTEDHKAFMDSPFGTFVVLGREGRVYNAGFTRKKGRTSADLPGFMTDCLDQLEGYFRGELTRFDVPLLLQGTEFQLEVWEQLRRIPYGETRSYGQLARAIDRPSAARAVGGACRSNPVGVIVPCHRVIGADGSLVGFGGQTKDLSLKRALIEHEARGRMTSLRDFG